MLFIVFRTPSSVKLAPSKTLPWTTAVLLLTSLTFMIATLVRSATWQMLRTVGLCSRVLCRPREERTSGEGARQRRTVNILESIPGRQQSMLFARSVMPMLERCAAVRPLRTCFATLLHLTPRKLLVCRRLVIHTEVVCVTSPTRLDPRVGAGMTNVLRRLNPVMRLCLTLTCLRLPRWNRKWTTFLSCVLLSRWTIPFWEIFTRVETRRRAQPLTQQSYAVPSTSRHLLLATLRSCFPPDRSVRAECFEAPVGAFRV